MNDRATLAFVGTPNPKRRSGRDDETPSLTFPPLGSRHLDRYRPLHRFGLAWIAFVIAMPLARAADSSSPRPSATPSPDPAVEQFVRGLRERFNLQQNDSGLLFRITQPNSGPRARPSDMVSITFTARLVNGATVPALSVREAKIKVADLPPALAEAAQSLPIGTKATLCVLPHLSFGSGPWPKGVRPGSPIFYDLELHDIAPASESPRKNAREPA